MLMEVIFKCSSLLPEMALNIFTGQKTELKLLGSGMKYDGHGQMKSPELVPVLKDT